MVGKWHLTPSNQETGGGPVRPLAARARLRTLLRLPRRRHQPVVSRPGLRQPPGRTAGDARRGLPPHRGPRRQVDRVHHRRQADRPRQAVLPAPLLRRHPRAAPRPQGVGRQVRRPVRRRLGRLPREDLRPPEGAGHRPGRRRALAPRSRRPRLGLALARRAPALQPHDGGLRRLPQPHRPPPRTAARLPERRSAQLDNTIDHGDLGQRRERRGRPHRHHQRGAVLQQRPRAAGGQPQGHRRDRRPQPLQPLPVGLDVGGQHAVPPLEAGDLPGRRLRPLHRLLAGGHQSQGRGADPVRPHHRHGADRPRPARPRAAGDDPRRHAVAAPGRQLRAHARRRRGADQAPHPVLRDARPPRHLPRRLAGGLPLARPVVHRGRRSVRPADLVRRSSPSSTPRAGSSTTSTRTSPRTTTSPPRTGTSSSP